MSKKSPSARVTLIYKNLTLVNISVKIQEARKMSKKSPLRRITFDVSVTHRALRQKNGKVDEVVAFCFLYNVNYDSV